MKPIDLKDLCEATPDIPEANILRSALYSVI
jgi:hypothetical protein